MGKIVIHLNPALLSLLAVFSLWASAKQEPARKAEEAAALCSPLLHSAAGEQERARSRLENKLRHPDTLPRHAIAEIVKFLGSVSGWDGERKYAEWSKFVHVYNHRRMNFWINAPSLVAAGGERVAWGETRGHILIFTQSGEVFTSYNPLRPNPVSPYSIDWTDPTLVRRGPH